MKSIHRILAALALLTLTAGSALAQQQEQFLIPIPEKLERKTVTDEEGLLQWAEYEAEPCVNCKGRKTMTCQHCARFDEGDCEECPECHDEEKAVCRICAGSGEMPDILVTAPCPTCFGAAVTRCFICNGRGQFPVEGGGTRKQKCTCCDGKGGFACGTCKGARYVDPPTLKPSASEATAKDLLKAVAALEKIQAAVSLFESTGDGRKDIKLLSKALAPAGRTFPALRSADKEFEKSTKDQAKGAVWKHYSEAVAASASSAKQTLEFYLKHQKRLLELCLARAEHNEGLK